MRVPAPLRLPRFRRLLAAYLVTSVGDWLSLIALSFGVLRFGTASSLGLVLLARQLTAALAVLAGGVLSDRLSRSRVLAIGWSFAGSAQLLCGLVALPSESLALTIACQVFVGAGIAVTRPAVTSAVPDLVPADQVQTAMGFVSMSRSSVALAGAALGAGIVTVFSSRVALVVDGVSFLVAAAIALSVATPSRERSGSTAAADLVEGWRDFTARRWLWVTVLTFALFQLSYFPAFETLGPVISLDRLHGAGGWALIVGAGAAGSFSGAALSTLLHFRRPLIFIIAALLPSLAVVALLSSGAQLAVLAVAAFAASAALAASDAIWFSTLALHLPSDVLGRVSSIDWLGSLALVPLGFALVGPASERIGPDETLLASTLIGLVCCCSALAVPDVRRLPRFPDAAEHTDAVRVSLPATELHAGALTLEEG